VIFWTLHLAIKILLEVTNEILNILVQRFFITQKKESHTGLE